MKLLPNPNLPWPIDYELGVVPIAGSESCKLRSYLCPAARWTNGWGETDGVGPNMVWTQDYADQRFCDSLTELTREVLEACTRTPTMPQLCALVSLAYNIGMGWKGAKKPAGAKNGFRQSTVLRAHNRGDSLAASRAFGLWNKYTNPVTKKLEESNGLTARRARESALYLQPDEQAQQLPQEVAAESGVGKSPIAGAGTAVAGTGAVLGTLQSAGESATTASAAVKSGREFLVETLGVPADWFLPLLLVAAGVAIVWYRNKQRTQGWA